MIKLFDVDRQHNGTILSTTILGYCSIKCVTPMNQESGRKAEYCRIENKTDDRALTLVGAMEPRSTSQRRGKDTREAKPNQIHNDYSTARLLLIWAQLPTNNPLTNC
jgi:hypothetical protein